MDEEKPPDPPDKSEYSPVLCVTLPHDNQDIDLMDSEPNHNRKRPAGSPIISRNNPPKLAKSINGRQCYTARDNPPYIIHVSLKDSQTIGTTLHPIKFGMFLTKNNISNIKIGGVKRLGRNRVSVEFVSHQDANSFLVNCVVAQNYTTSIPQYNITRMGIVRDVPIEWTEEEIIRNIKVPAGCGIAIKARRMNRRVSSENGTEWKPTQTVVLTFDGQILPKKVFCFYSALPVELYTYPTIQCFNCCRFGHTRTLCRSKPRCFRCGQDHPGDGCLVSEEVAHCINCNGNHFANNSACPELGRQKSIKALMAEKAISYAEASQVFPAVKKSYAEWNVRSTLPRKSDLLHLINKFKPTICGIAETWLRPNINFRVPCFSVVRHDRSDGYGGCALLVSNKVPFSQIPLPFVGDDINVVAVKAEDINIFMFYIAHPHINHLAIIKNLLMSVSGPLLVMGDFNCHHFRWGSDTCDNIGTELVEMLDELNLCAINDGSPTRRSAFGQRSSCVDLTFCSANMASMLNWSCLNMTYGSDHYPIIIKNPSKSTPDKSLPPLLKYRLEKADWDLYSKLLDLRISSLPLINTENALECFSKFSELISSTAEDCFPLKNTPKGKIPSPPWWDSECTAMIRARNEAEKAYNRDMNLENLFNFKRMLARSRKLFKKKKKQGWQRFCTSLSPSTPVAAVWQRVKSFRNSMKPPSISIMPEGLSHNFFSSIAPLYVPGEDEFCLGHHEESLDPLDRNFSMDELQMVLNHVKDSAPGIDGFPYSFLVKAGAKTKQYYLDLVNFCLAFGYIPPPWKVQVIMPLLKAGKDPGDHSSYRPIALSSILIKILEHLLKTRLEWSMEGRGLFPAAQFGFRKGLGTADSVGTLTSAIRLALSRDESLVAVFLDVSSAYDSVLLPLLRQKLQELRIPSRICQIIGCILSNRTLQLRTPEDDPTQRTAWRGLPQGSVLSPILYNIYTHDLPSCLNYDCRILQYADDIALMVTSSSITDATTSMNVSLASLHQWLLSHGLSLSAPKSSAVIFSRRRRLPDIRIEIDGQPIPVMRKARFLGVILDSRMSGVDHVDAVVKRCERSVCVLRALAGVWWGAHPYTLKLIYNALVRSVMDYCCFLIAPCNKEAFKKLDSIQAKCLRIIIGAMKSSPINALQVECAEPPLDLRRQYLADRFVSKVLTRSSHPLLPILEQIHCSYGSSPYWNNKPVPPVIVRYRELKNLSAPISQHPILPVFSSAYEVIHFKPKLVLRLGISKSSVDARRDFGRALSNYWNGWNMFYTDASKLSRNGCTGVAAYYQNSRIALLSKCPPEASVFTGECIGILESIKFIKSHNLSNSVIFSDSRSSLQALGQDQLYSRTHSSIIMQIKSLLFSCQKDGLNIEIAWIPGHSGICGNECADRLAKFAAVNNVERHHYIVYGYDIRADTKLKLFDSWAAVWVDSSKRKGAYYLLTTKNYRKVKRSTTTPVQL
ncbi:uncharacterized protein LOC111357833 [Spodoptera litura]|uniref:Uncharacterized protein LOC111357833 n=1 Tax=Spodoptera litura TaxID=69820 RepID=A0A9J7IXA9_SPOLT|nr:uncharacterized protein LOC111357833 [Spodoptera litura]